MEGNDILKNIKDLSLEQKTVQPFPFHRLALNSTHMVRMKHLVYGNTDMRDCKNNLNEDSMFVRRWTINYNKRAITIDLGILEAQKMLKGSLVGLNGRTKDRRPPCWFCRNNKESLCQDM